MIPSEDWEYVCMHMCVHSVGRGGAGSCSVTWVPRSTAVCVHVHVGEQRHAGGYLVNDEVRYRAATTGRGVGQAAWDCHIDP